MTHKPLICVEKDPSHSLFPREMPFCYLVTQVMTLTRPHTTYCGRIQRSIFPLFFSFFFFSPLFLSSHLQFASLRSANPISAIESRSESSTNTRSPFSPLLLRRSVRLFFLDSRTYTKRRRSIGIPKLRRYRWSGFNETSCTSDMTVLAAEGLERERGVASALVHRGQGRRRQTSEITLAAGGQGKDGWGLHKGHVDDDFSAIAFDTCRPFIVSEDRRLK